MGLVGKSGFVVFFTTIPMVVRFPSGISTI